MSNNIELTRMKLPEYGLPDEAPELSPEIYRKRLSAFIRRSQAAGYQVMAVYGDREHFSNLRYLTGYDPRFEEALLLLDLTGSSRRPLLLAGNEGFGYSNTSPVRGDLDVELFQSFSLLGQDRTQSRPLSDILTEFGVSAGTVVGVTGWKHFTSGEGASPDTMLEIPSYIVDLLRELTGDRSKVLNANGLLMSAEDGMRIVNEPEQLAWFEFAATYASQGVRNVLFADKVGKTEYALAEAMKLNGIPQSCHPMLSAGDRAFYGMGSPSSRRVKHQDPFTTAIGLWGSLTSRGGFIVESADELPENISDYLEKLVIPYFRAIVMWYETVGIGTTGGALYDVIHRQIGDPFFGVALNPGHFVHLDEWVNSPVFAGSNIRLESGMALQVDVIPATGTPYYTTNLEDGVILADEALREELSGTYQSAWRRIEARREFMRDTLGITLKPEVLPLSNLQGYLAPFLLAPDTALRLV
ncbi:MAG: hypothetical protein HN368_09060 [Spirochaetales bacterium]|nr:hypothetical protein [Spirochaetales bacterium]